MPIDILIFAAVAAILAYKLYTVMGVPPETGEPAPRAPVQLAPAPQATAEPIEASALVAEAAVAGVNEIIAADPHFEPAQFLSGAGMAFGLIVDAYAKGDRAALRPLLSPKLYADFDAGIAARGAEGPVAPGTVASSRIVEAHMGGAMAYVTVDFDIVPHDVRDVWTFTRDTRASDPNWILIETRTAGA